MTIVTRRNLIAGSLGLIAAGPWPNAAEAARWILLGAKKVSLGLDRDVIHVGPMPHRFDRIKVRADLNDIQMLDLAVVYGNGKRDDIPVRSIIRKNTETNPRDLKGDGRDIRKIEMIYARNPNRALFAVVTVFGRTD
jgi:hypothetical protein